MKYIRLVFATTALAAVFVMSGTHAQATDNTEAVENVLLQNSDLVREYVLDQDLQQQVKTGYKINPVPLDTAGKNVILLGLGSYIVNAQSGCNDCHTSPSYAPGGDPAMGQPEQINVAGYLAGGRQFVPPGVVSRNLTPENGLPAGRTYAEFEQVMRTGIDLDQAHPQLEPLLQVMPWSVYQKMSDRDLLAIYTYLSAIPAVTPKN